MLFVIAAADRVLRTGAILHEGCCDRPGCLHSRRLATQTKIGKVLPRGRKVFSTERNALPRPAYLLAQLGTAAAVLAQQKIPIRYTVHPRQPLETSLPKIYLAFAQASNQVFRMEVVFLVFSSRQCEKRSFYSRA